VSLCFKKESNNNNEVSSGHQPYHSGVQSDDGGVKPDHDAGVWPNDGGVHLDHDDGVKHNNGGVQSNHEDIVAIKSEVWINKIINIYL